MPFDSLDIVIQGTSTKATASIDRTTKALSSMGTTLSNLQGISNLHTLAGGLKNLASVPKFKINKSTANAITSINNALAGVDASTISKANTLSRALTILANIPKSDLGSLASPLRSIPKSVEALSEIDLSKVTPQLQRITAAMQPLATVMQPIADGFSAMPVKLQSYITQMNKASGAASRSAKSHGGLFSVLRSGYFKMFLTSAIVKRAGDVIGSYVGESNAFIENANLFDVAMGKNADSARNFAEQVNTLMGIDISEWQRTQGTFKMIGSGFGLGDETSNTMSQQLTQLAYDASSFYNIPIKDAIVDFQSAIAGELEPVRRLGFALDQATLQQLAYNLGIEKSIQKMTQAEKSLLRYHALMTQNTQIHGDMARTLESPANALRIFDQQIQQLKRSIGNIFIPIISAMLPYLTAVVQLLKEGANWLAALMGFELPKFDYSGIDVKPVVETADAFDDVGANADRAGQKVKEFKNYLLGFDEMHIIPDNADANTGGGLGGANGSPLGAGFDIPLETYDFLGGLQDKVDKIKDSMRGFLEQVGKVLEVIWKLRDFVKAGLIVGGLMKVGGWLDKILGSVLGLKNVNLFKTLLGGIGAGIAEFFLISEGIRGLVNGTDELWVGLTKIAGGAAIGAAGMYLAFGPAGLAVAAVVGLLAAINGTRQGLEDLIAVAVNDTFYNETGIKISELGTAYEQLVQSMFPVNQTIIEQGGTLDASQEKVTNLKTEVQAYMTAWSDGAIDALEAGEKIKELVKSIQTETETSLGAARKVIIEGFGGAFGESLKLAGIDVGAMMKMIDDITNNTTEKLNIITAEIDTLSQGYASGTVTTERYTLEMGELLGQLMDLKVGSDEVGNAQDTLNGILAAGVNWESANEREKFFSKVTETYNTAKQGIEQEGEAYIKSLQYYKSLTDDPTLQIQFDTLITNAQTNRTETIGKLNETVDGLFADITQSLGNRLPEMVEVGKQKFNESNWVERIIMPERASINTAISTFNTEHVQPITEGMTTALENMGREGSTAASTAMSNVVAAFYDTNSVTQSVGNQVKTESPIDAIIELAKQDIMNFKDGVPDEARAASQEVVNALESGLSDVSGVELATTDLATKIPDAFKRSLDINSPSKVMENLTGEAVRGVEVALENTAEVRTNSENLALTIIGGFTKIMNENDLVSGFSNVASEILGVFNSMFSQMTMGMNSTLSAMGNSVTSFNTTTTPTSRSYSYTPARPPSVRMYAKGGFPTAGELFFANEGGNPELVGRMGNKTAVANQGQIAEGFAMAIRPAIADGVREAMLESGGDTIVNVGGRTLAKITSSEARRMNRRAGKTVVSV